jgi:hypothetical protein
VRAAWLVVALSLLAPSVGAQEEENSNVTNLLGSVRSGYWFRSRKLDERENLATEAIWLKVSSTIGKHASLLADVWFGTQDLVTLAGGNSQTGRNSTTAPGTQVEGRVREAYFDLHLGPLDLRVGKQLSIWGRADTWNPTDNLSPRDYTLLTPDDSDQRSGTIGLKATYYLAHNLALTGFWIPYFTPSVFPVLPPNPAMSGMRSGGTVSCIMIRNSCTPLANMNIIPSSETWYLGQGALRLELSGGAIDGSISYYHGLDLSPDMWPTVRTATSIDVNLVHHPVDVVGFDFATNLGRFGLRGEAAYTFTQNLDGKDPLVKKPFLYAVLGVDRTFGEYLNVNVQGLFRWVTNFQDPATQLAMRSGPGGVPLDPVQQEQLLSVAILEETINNQLDPFNYGISVRITDQWLHETLQAEVSGLAWVYPRASYGLRTKVAYAITDRLKVIAGADYFDGRTPSVFDNLHSNSTIYAEARFGF